MSEEWMVIGEEWMVIDEDEGHHRREAPISVPSVWLTNPALLSPPSVTYTVPLDPALVAQLTRIEEKLDHLLAVLEHQ